MDVSAALVAYPQPAELVEPTQGPLHYPAVHSQSTAVFGAPSGQGWRDMARPRLVAMPPRDIGPVGVLPLGSAPLVMHRRHGVHQGQQLVTSWRLAPVGMADSGVPLASVST